ncbi:small RNA 2'-O-methyltransferase [Cyprinodon tularosa]|uniref:small RNA 2'-O-methyltransferase n=1 Tax=Cyprinodon tularosa TaxID=77115 RepID=UPI0018E1F14F|nr:small RNA 2'-O-methyltransferase [Cyprinodon tularosa]
MNPVFTPPLHLQRHQFVVDFVRKTKPKKVADLGCGECKLLKQLKFHRSIELLVGVDINGAKIKKQVHGLAPLSTDYLQPTNHQLHVELYQGSVTQRDARLRGFDLVTSMELIEHLTLPDVEHFSSVVFGYMSPASVIISTPNSEFNRLLPGLTGFRNYDHKFEWNRSQFRSWAVKVCLDHGYEVEFTGVGEPPQNQLESVGFCTQIGVFHRLKGSSHGNVLPGSEDEVFSYTSVYSINYPSLHDNNTLCKVLMSEVLYWAHQMTNSWMGEKPGRPNGDLPHRESEQGEPEEWLSESQKQRACTGGLACSVDYFGRGEEQECGELPQQQRSATFNRFILVPLDGLWSCCPKIRELSGSVENLKQLLMDQPQVNISQDGSSLLVKCEDQDPEQVDCDLEDDKGTMAVPVSCPAEPEEDWEADI